MGGGIGGGGRYWEGRYWGGGGDDCTTKYDTNHTFLEGHITHVFKVCFKDPSLRKTILIFRLYNQQI